MSNENTEALQKLREPFPASAISKLPKGGVYLDYVGHAETTDRLLSADPLWSWEPFALDERGLPAIDYDAGGKPVGLWIKLTVCGVTRPGYGTCEARKSEAIKELIGDAIRNAAMRFGVALDLWAESDLESQKHEGEPEQPQPRRNGNPLDRVTALTEQQRPPQATQRPQNGNGAAVSCPKCSGPMWDNRAKKANGEMKPTNPDFKCKDRQNCDGVIWPPKASEARVSVADPADEWATPDTEIDAEFAGAHN